MRLTALELGNEINTPGYNRDIAASGKGCINDVGLLVQYRVAARLAVESSAP